MYQHRQMNRDGRHTRGNNVAIETAGGSSQGGTWNLTRNLSIPCMAEWHYILAMKFAMEIVNFIATSHLMQGFPEHLVQCLCSAFCIPDVACSTHDALSQETAMLLYCYSIISSSHLQPVASELMSKVHLPGNLMLSLESGSTVPDLLDSKCTPARAALSVYADAESVTPP